MKVDIYVFNSHFQIKTSLSDSALRCNRIYPFIHFLFCDR